MYEYLLPIGSIVSLKKSPIKFMIYGNLPVVNLKTKEKMDYLIVPYPFGYLGDKRQLAINHDDINEVIHKGLDGEDWSNYIKTLEAFENVDLEKLRDAKE